MLCSATIESRTRGNDAAPGAARLTPTATSRFSQLYFREAVSKTGVVRTYGSSPSGV